jgi:hypothetical protein
MGCKLKITNVHCHKLSLSFATKANAWKGASQECNPGVTFTFLGVWESVMEWAHTLPSGLPLWELKSLWSFKTSKNNLKGQNSLDWKLPYTIRKLLRQIYLKWVIMIDLNIYNTNYGRKKGHESKCQFDSWPLKVKNLLVLRQCKRCGTYRWKDLNEGYNFALDFTSIRGFHKKLWSSKVARVPRKMIVGCNLRGQS